MIEKYPGDWQLAYRLGDALVEKGNLSEAVPYFERAIQVAPTDQFYPYQGLASVYYQLNYYERAANVLERWLILHPDDTNVRPLYDQLMNSLRTGEPLPGANGESEPDSVPSPDGN
jgi:tetratricopeptide (TPR) repeat protein